MTALPALDPLRTLILAPHGRDALVAWSLLAEAGLSAAVCENLNDLVLHLWEGAGAVLVIEEVLRSADLTALSVWLEDQPAWSDLPIILLTQRGGGPERNPAAQRLSQALGNVSFMERPFHPTTLISAVQVALRGRRRQYEARPPAPRLRVTPHRRRR